MKTLRFLCLTGCLLTPMLLGNVAMAAPKTAATQSNDENDLWAEVQKGGAAEDYQAYLDAYPTGKYAPLAKSRLKKRTGQPTPAKRGKASRLPPRPELPFAVSEDVWQSLEASDDYRLWPKLKATIRVNARYTVRSLDVQGKEVSAEKNNSEIEIAPLGEKCVVQTTIITSPLAGSERTYKSKCKSFTCAGISMGLITNLHESGNDAVNNRLSAQNTIYSHTALLAHLEMQAGLYPLSVGAEYSVKDTHTTDGQPFLTETKCRVTDKKSAAELHPLFTGAVWTVECERKFTSAYQISPINYTSYFIESLGVTLVDIVEDGQHLLGYDHLPKLGEPIVQTFPGGAKRIVTYEQYNLSIDRE